MSTSNDAARKRDALAGMCACFDTPFDQDAESWAVKLKGYAATMKEWPVETVERAVQEFITGKVERPASKRGRLPTSEELGAHFRVVAAEMGKASSRDREVFAPPAGPAWGDEVYRLLLAGPDAGMRKPTAFIAKLIAEGGEAGERAKRHYQAVNGFAKVNMLFERARDAKGSMVSVSAIERAGLMEAVPIGSPVFDQWKIEHERRGWPWFPDLGKQRVIWLPRGGPEQFAAFEAATTLAKVAA